MLKDFSIYCEHFLNYSIKDINERVLSTDCLFYKKE